MTNKKKPKYVRMSSEDFKAVCDALFSQPRPQVKYTGQTFRGVRD